MIDEATLGRVLREQARFIESQESLRTKADVVQYLIDVADELERDGTTP